MIQAFSVLVLFIGWLGLSIGDWELSEGTALIILLGETAIFMILLVPAGMVHLGH